MWTGMAQLTICSKKQKVRYVNMHATVQPEYWWESNLAVGSKIAIATVLADLNLVVRYGIAIPVCIYMYVCKKYWQILIWRLKRMTATAKFNSPPNFPVIWKVNVHSLTLVTVTYIQWFLQIVFSEGSTKVLRQAPYYVCTSTLAVAVCIHGHLHM